MWNAVGRHRGKTAHVGLAARSSIPHTDEAALSALPHVLHRTLRSDSRDPAWEGESADAGGGASDSLCLREE